ncbi:MAG: hypothetical protein IJY53_00575, partial [Akkermansia sp.]|nr:hypothetical protein [Akkermansia sp.]
MRLHFLCCHDEDKNSEYATKCIFYLDKVKKYSYFRVKLYRSCMKTLSLFSLILAGGIALAPSLYGYYDVRT